MAEYKKIIPRLVISDGKAVLVGGRVYGNVPDLCRIYSDSGADEIFIWEEPSDEEGHERTISLIKRIVHSVDIPIAVGGILRVMDDVKKYLYAGAKTIVFSDDDPTQLIKEAVERFGKEKVAIKARDISDGFDYAACGISRVFYPKDCQSKEDIDNIKAFPLPLVLEWQEQLVDIPTVSGMMLSVPQEEADRLMEKKLAWKSRGILVNLCEPSLTWDELKKNGDGLVPVVTQDYETDEVLMVAYMNREAYEATARTGKMIYFSRSRQELWEKGVTSGHYQYVKELRVDCDNDTLLAKVAQTGAACHTGNHSCFYRQILKKSYDERNPMKVLEQIYNVIKDRKVNPREGSYTNYLFDKGIDKILKKVGEEATETVIAAKNPNNEELIYEISDLMYHLMVLMAEKELSWLDIMDELSNR